MMEIISAGQVYRAQVMKVFHSSFPPTCSVGVVLQDSNLAAKRNPYISSTGIVKTDWRMHPTMMTQP